jgi:phosphoinositide-3-kinase regulatory subunit 4
MLVYATTHSNIVMLDLRTMNILQTMENPRHHGPITSFCIDKKRAWIVVGTSTGVLTLWDKRFGLLLRTWRAGVTAAGASTGRSVRIHQCVVHPSSRSRGKWVMVALSLSSSSRKNNSDFPPSCLIEVWDIEKAVLVETYVTRTGSASDPVSELVSGEVVGQDVETTAAAAISALVRSSQEGGTSDDFGDMTGSAPPPDVPHPPHCDVRAMVVGSDFGVYMAHQRPEYGELDMIPSSSRSSGRGFIVTGSEDAKIRLWDLGKFEKSTVLSGTESDLEKPSYRSASSSFARIL